MTTSEHRQQRLGSLLVFLQFSLILVLVWLALPGLMAGNRPSGALLFAVIGLALGIWALSVNKVGNFNIHPSPKVGGDMVCEGPLSLDTSPHVHQCIGLRRLLCVVG